MIRSATALASRGRSSGSAARQSLASAIKSTSAPQPPEPLEGFGGFAPRCLAEDLARGPARERRRTREDLGEDRPECEDVGPLVDQVNLAPGLLRWHVARRAQD